MVPEANDPGTPTLLIVDDDLPFLHLMEIYGTVKPFVPLICSVARSAAPIAHRCRPNAILLDLRLPSIEDGETVLRELRLDPVTASIPVIVMTADHRGLRQREVDLQQQCDALITKPFNLEQLYDLISMMFDCKDVPDDADAWQPRAGTDTGEEVSSVPSKDLGRRLQTKDDPCASILRTSNVGPGWTTRHVVGELVEGLLAVTYYTAQPAPTQWIAVGCLQDKARVVLSPKPGIVVGSGRNEAAAILELRRRLKDIQAELEQCFSTCWAVCHDCP